MIIITAIIIRCIKQSLVKLAKFIKDKKQTWVVLFFWILVICKLLREVIVLFRSFVAILKIDC